MTVNWSGVDAGALVEIRGVSAPNDPGAPAVTFFCVEKAGAGQFTIPPNVLLSLPVAGSSTAASGSALGLSVGVTGAVRFTAPGVGRRPASLQFSVRAKRQFSVERALHPTVFTSVAC